MPQPGCHDFRRKESFYRTPSFPRSSSIFASPTKKQKGEEGESPFHLFFSAVLWVAESGSLREQKKKYLPTSPTHTQKKRSNSSFFPTSVSLKKLLFRETKTFVPPPSSAQKEKRHKREIFQSTACSSRIHLFFSISISPPPSPLSLFGSSVCVFE